MWSSERRRWLAMASGLALAACGFELRRAPELRFRTLALAGFAAGSPLAQELRQRLAESTTTRVVDAVSQAEVVLEATADGRERVVVSSNAFGQVLEITLRVRFDFRLRTPTGKELSPPDEILLTRDMSYTETAALAKELEEATLYRALQSDIVDQVLRRLAALKVA